MNSKVIIAGVALVILLAGGAYAYKQYSGAEACIPGTCTTAPVVLKARLNQVSSTGAVKITPLEIVEESRCAIGVQCIQAGTVRVRALLETGMGSAPQIFALDTPITTEGEIIELIEVTPYPKAGEQIKPADYAFTFTITKRGGIY